MLLSKKEIQDKLLIEGADPKMYRPSSYDLTAEIIIDHNGKRLEECLLPPNGIVEVISKERVKVPSDICGYAHIKTSMCDRGILALNIGIVDPGWHGKLSTTLVNFSNKKQLIKKGEEFLRLSFHAYTPHEIVPKSEWEDDKYITVKRRKAINNFNKFFIDMSEASRKTFGQYKAWLTAWIPIAVIVITIVLAMSTYYATFLANNNSIGLTRDYWLPTADTVRKEFDAYKNYVASLENTVSELKGDLIKEQARTTALTQDIDALRVEIKNLKASRGGK